MRWSDAMKLSEYRDWRFWLDGYSGCYQIGVYWRGEFQPKYIGRAKNLWTRIDSYMDPRKCHNPQIMSKLFAQRHNLWFRAIRTPRFHGLEARQQAIHGVNYDGLYVWNKRVEWACLNM